MPTLFLNLDPNKFIWMDKGWLTSLWEFIYAADLQIHYPEQWLPTQSRENVIFLMEWLLTKNLKANEIRLLNSCRLYLQVVTLSDIVSANGLYILPEIKAGKTLADRQSNWDWPTQGRPTTVAWSLWNDQLSSLEHKGKLKIPLGRWINWTHQQWTTCLDPQTRTLFICDSRKVRKDLPTYTNRQIQTRSTITPWDDISTMILTQEEPPETVVPATIEQDMIGSPIVKVNYSDSKLTPSLTRAAEHPTPSISTQVLDNLGALTPLEEICKAAASGRLILSCDGSYQPDTRQASYSWVFSDGSKICDGSGSIQSSTNNPYRAELYAILVSMIILQHATRSCKVQGGGARWPS